MAGDSPKISSGEVCLSLDDLLAEAQAAARDSIPPNTARAYRTDWNDFRKFCERQRLSLLPARAETVCAYLAARARCHKTSTLRRRLTVIGKVHRIRGCANPLDDMRVKQTWRGLLRQRSACTTQKSPALLRDLQAIAGAFGDSLADLRDRAIILLGFAAGMRRSELVALDVSSFEQAEEGLVLYIARSKTDQTGRGRKVGIPFGQNPLTCPVRAVQTWLEASQISGDALFRKVNRHGRLEGKRLSAHSVALIVKRAFERIGKVPAAFSGHSLRAGLATQAAMSGASERSIQNQTGHRSLAVLRRYIRDGSLFRENAAKKTGL